MLDEICPLRCVSVVEEGVTPGETRVDERVATRENTRCSVVDKRRVDEEVVRAGCLAVTADGRPPTVRHGLEQL